MITVLVVIHFLIFVSFVLRTLYRDDLSSSARLAWFVVLVSVPYVGVVIYLLFGEINLGKTIYKRHEEVFAKIMTADPAALGDCKKNLPQHVDVQYHAPFLAASAADNFQTTIGNRGELLANGIVARQRLIDDIDNAQTHVHVLNYIWFDDGTGANVANALIRAAKRGVKCRAMADGLGGRSIIRSDLWKQMEQAGVLVSVALPIKRLLTTILWSRLDLRNHRKITLIDGKICWCGSQNCADPMIRTKLKYSPWVDIMIRFQGPVVAQSQLLFASDWMMQNPDDSLDEFPLHIDPLPDGFAAQVFADGPTVRLGSTPQLLSTLITSARTRLTITTPYFVPDPTVMNALCAAAYRGIDVTMVFPKHNDSRIVAAASRSYYRRLLEAGINIEEFSGGMLHSKTLTIDGVLTMIGSTNLDVRSFDLNYENDILFYDQALTRKVIDRQSFYRSQSKSVLLEDVMAWSPIRRIWNNVIATFGPIL